MRPLSIFQQIVALALAMVAIAVAIAALLVFALPPPQPARMSVDEMTWALDGKTSKIIETHLAAVPPAGTRTQLVEAAIARQLGRPADEIRAVWVREPLGGIDLGQSMVLINGREALVDVTASGFRLRSGPGTELRTDTLLPLVVSARRGPDGRWIWAVPHDPELATWRMRISFGLVVGSLLLALLGWFIARRIAAPIEMLGGVAAAADLRALGPLPDRGPREVRRVAEAIASMHHRMVAAASEQLRILAAVAHDLRTPMTALRVRVEGLNEPLRERMVADLERMSDMVAEMLDLAETAAIEPRLNPVDVAALVHAKHGIAREIGHLVEVERLDPLIVITDAAMLARMMDNLVDNGLRYGTAVRIRLERFDHSARLIIDSDGPGIPPEQLREVVRPFVRLDTSRNRRRGGTGLGLAIVTQFADLLNIKFSLENLSHGLRATILFSQSDLGT